MRRAFFLCLGLFELAVAGVLLAIGLLLPGPTALRQTFGQAERVTASAEQQVTLLSNDLNAVNAKRVQRLVRDIEPTLPRTLGSLARGMDAWAGALDPELLSQLHDGIGRLANFLDQSVAPAAGRYADRLETITAALRKDALVLDQLLKSGPLDANRVKAMREGFKGLETSLATGADQVAKLASYTYPVVKFQGLKPIVDEKPFWPEGGRVAEGMRKGAKALKAVGKEFDSQVANLPKLRKALDESSQAVARLGKQSTTGDLTKLLREAKQLNEVATALRGKQQNIEKAMKTWPVLRTRLQDSAGRIRKLETQLNDLLNDSATEKRLARLEKQRKGLDELGASLKEVQGSLPDMANTAATVTLLLRCLLWLLASLTFVHSCYQVTRGHRPRPAAVA